DGRGGGGKRGRGVVVGRGDVGRVRRGARLWLVALVEGVAIDGEGAAAAQVLDVRAQRSRIHRDQHVGLVAGREDVVIRKVDLEAGDARQRARRRPDLGRKVG